MAHPWLRRHRIVGRLAICLIIAVGLIVQLASSVEAGPSRQVPSDSPSPGNVSAEPILPPEARTAGPCVAIPEVGGFDAEGMVPFQSLAQGNVFDHGPPRSILTVSQRPDPIALVVDPASRPDLASVDLSTNVLVGLFIGQSPQQGHRVSIQSIQTTDSGVCLTALLTGPAPGQDAADAETYPYHVVAVPLAAIPQTAGTPWTVVSPDGAIIAATTFP